MENKSHSVGHKIFYGVYDEANYHRPSELASNYEELIKRYYKNPELRINNLTSVMIDIISHYPQLPVTNVRDYPTPKHSASQCLEQQSNKDTEEQLKQAFMSGATLGQSFKNKTPEQLYNEYGISDSQK